MHNTSSEEKFYTESFYRRKNIALFMILICLDFSFVFIRYSRYTCPCSQPTKAVDLSIMPDLGDEVL